MQPGRIRLAAAVRLAAGPGAIDEGAGKGEAGVAETPGYGFDFLGFRIQRQQKRGSDKRFVYTWPSKKALASVKAKVRAMTRGGTNQPLAALLSRLNPVLRGWANYFRHGVSKATFDYLRAFTWRRVFIWLRHKHRHMGRKKLVRRYYKQWCPTEGNVTLFNPSSIAVSRYRYRGAQIPTPWTRAKAEVA